MDDYTGKKEGKYSNKRKKELNGYQPLVNEKKNKYITYDESTEIKYFNNTIFDSNYYDLNSILIESNTPDYLLENNKIFKEFIRKIYNDNECELLRLVDFIELFKTYVDKGIHDEEYVLYTHKTVFDILDKYIIYAGQFYFIDDVKDRCSFIMKGLNHPTLIKYFFEKQIGKCDHQGNLMECVLEYARLNKKNSIGTDLFAFNSLKELLDDICVRFRCNIIDTNNYTFHKWTLTRRET
jgi:hypothetical protein